MLMIGLTLALRALFMVVIMLGLVPMLMIMLRVMLVV